MDSYKTTFQTWNKVASLYQDKFMDMDLYNDTYDRFCQLVEKREAKVFEIGCGPGNITRFIKSRRPDFQVDAIDVAPAMIQLARNNVPAVRFHVMDCRAIDAIDDHFHGILCGFCLPYLSREDSAKLFRDCAALLVEEGIVYFSAIEGDYSRSGYKTASTGDKCYVYYYEEAELRAALEAAGFDILEVFRKPNPIDGGVSTDLVFLARKK